MSKLEIEESPLAKATVLQLLQELEQRGSTMKAVAEAQLLVLRKSADYNQTGMGGSQTVEAAAYADRDSYFPFGLESYCHMIHTKAQRLVSLALKRRAGLPANFEGLKDTALDIINYASFLVERMDRPGQEGEL